MENEYITNMNSNAIIDENETIQKLKKAEDELVEIKKNLDEKKEEKNEKKEEKENKEKKDDKKNGNEIPVEDIIEDIADIEDIDELSANKNSGNYNSSQTISQSQGNDNTVDSHMLENYNYVEQNEKKIT